MKRIDVLTPGFFGWNLTNTSISFCGGKTNIMVFLCGTYTEFLTFNTFLRYGLELFNTNSQSSRDINKEFTLDIKKKFLIIIISKH